MSSMLLTASSPRWTLAPLEDKCSATGRLHCGDCCGPVTTVAWQKAVPSMRAHAQSRTTASGTLWRTGATRGTHGNSGNRNRSCLQPCNLGGDQAKFVRPSCSVCRVLEQIHRLEVRELELDEHGLSGSPAANAVSCGRRAGSSNTALWRRGESKCFLRCMLKRTTSNMEKQTTCSSQQSKLWLRCSLPLASRTEERAAEWTCTATTQGQDKKR